MKLGERHTPVARILAAKRPEEIIATLSFAGRRPIADRIGELYAMTRDGAPDEPQIVLASLRELALFLVSEPRLADPEIGVSPSGLLLAEWASTERGVLAMEFLPNGILQFAAVSAVGCANPKLRVHGDLPKDRALNAVRCFVPLVDRLGA